VLAEAADIDSLYEEAVFNLKHRMPAPPKTNTMLGMLEKEQAAKDYYAGVRTNVRAAASTDVLLLITITPQVLLLWALSNVSCGIACARR
jgi:chitin synthase